MAVGGLGPHLPLLFHELEWAAVDLRCLDMGSILQAVQTNNAMYTNPLGADTFVPQDWVDGAEVPYVRMVVEEDEISLSEKQRMRREARVEKNEVRDCAERIKFLLTTAWHDKDVFTRHLMALDVVTARKCLENMEHLMEDANMVDGGVGKKRSSK